MEIKYTRLKQALDSRMRATTQALDRRAAKGKPYLTPIETIEAFNERLRKLRDEEQPMRKKILKENIDMAASDERKAALVFRYVEEKKRVDAQLARVI